MLSYRFSFDYASRLKRDVEEWRERGWITPEGTRAILADIGKKEAGWPLSVTMISFAVILLGLGIILFVASNWDQMSRALRLSVLVSTSALAYVSSAACITYSRGASALAAFLGLIVFAGTLAFLSQSFHMTHQDESLVLGFALVALMGALLLDSRLHWISAFVAFTVWVVMETAPLYGVQWSQKQIDTGDILILPLHIQSFVATLALIWCALRLKWQFGLHLASLALIAWIMGVLPVFLWNWLPGFLVLASLALLLISLILAVVGGSSLHPALVRNRGSLVSHVSIFFFALSFISQSWAYNSAKLSIGPFVPVPRLEQLVAEMTLGFPDLIWLMFVVITLFLYLSVWLRTELVDSLSLAALALVTVLAQVVMRSTGQLPSVWFSAIFIVGFAIWLADYGRRTESILCRTIAYIAFILELGFVHYVFIDRRLLDTSLVFIIGGIGLLITAFVVIAFERLQQSREEAG